ncbi:chalcone isomerase family protein [Pseudomonas sp. CAN2814]|uniref:chalcone isomerase family protein n=1 Tax=Pseudomonas sp. CAN1 TaxID=3046726 RepID=UPI0026478EE1|nr:chalcone isomerase family protein [Pseudomonas sp. CAN1]MDN6858977.1 chalcone isomerase family protein [Pseudomonas sp. CAN1]
MHAGRYRRETVLFGLLLCLAASSVAADWRATLPSAAPLGSGEYRWYGLRLYSATLWSDSERPWPDQPFALELTYHRSLGRDTLVQASIEEIRRLQGDAVDEVTLARWSAEMGRAFADVSAGDRLVGVSVPGQGCRFYLNDQLRHEIADPRFAAAFFAIWLDPRTQAPELRRELLGDTRR